MSTKYCKVYKKLTFLTTYPPPLVNVVCERPLRLTAPINVVNRKEKNKASTKWSLTKIVALLYVILYVILYVTQIQEYNFVFRKLFLHIVRKISKLVLILCSNSYRKLVHFFLICNSKIQLLLFLFR